MPKPSLSKFTFLCPLAQSSENLMRPVKYVSWIYCSRIWERHLGCDFKAHAFMQMHLELRQVTAVWAHWGVRVCAWASEEKKRRKNLFSRALCLLITQKGCHSKQIAVTVWLMVAVMLLISFIQKIIPAKEKPVHLKCLSFCFQLQRSMTHRKVIPCSPDGVCWSGI